MRLYDIQTIVASGKGGHATIPAPIFEQTEAETYAGILRENDFEGKLLVESESTGSGANIQRSYQLLADSFEEKLALVISADFMEFFRGGLFEEIESSFLSSLAG